MEDGVFHHRLQRQLGQHGFVRLRAALDMQDEAVLKAVILNARIRLAVFQFIPQGYHIAWAADAVTKKAGERPGDVGDVLLVLQQRHAADALQRIVKKMRVDLALQGLQVRLFEQHLLFVIGVFHRARFLHAAGDHLLQFLL